MIQLKQIHARMKRLEELEKGLAADAARWQDGASTSNLKPMERQWYAGLYTFTGRG